MPFAPFTGQLDPVGTPASGKFVPFTGKLDFHDSQLPSKWENAKAAVEDVAKGAWHNLAHGEPGSWHEAAQTTQELLGDYGVPQAEAAANAVTMGYGFPISGIASLAAAAAKKAGFNVDPVRVEQWVQQALIYQPHTAEGQHLVNETFYPLNKLNQLGDHLADKTQEQGGSPKAAAFVKTAVTGGPMAILMGRGHGGPESAVEAPKPNVQDQLASQLGEHFQQPEPTTADAAKAITEAPDVDTAIKAAVDATSKPIQVPTPLEVHQSRIAWRQKWKTVQDIQAAFDQHKARQEALKEAELNQVQQAHREAPLTPEDLANARAMEPVTEAPQPEQPQPETAMSRAIKEAQGRDLLQRMEAWDQRRQANAVREQSPATLDVRQSPEHGEAVDEGNTGHQRPTGEEEAQAARPNSQPNEVTQQEQQPVSPPQQEGAGQAPRKLTRAALKKLQPKIDQMTPEEKEQTRKWLEASTKEHEKEGERIAQHCLGL